MVMKYKKNRNFQVVLRKVQFIQSPGTGQKLNQVVAKDPKLS
jgi:hypothetical protein